MVYQYNMLMKLMFILHKNHFDNTDIYGQLYREIN